MFLVPFTRNPELGRSLDRLFDEGIDRFFGLAPAVEGAPRSPALDLTENDESYTVRLDLPGVAKEDVQVSIEGRRVNVQAQTERKAEKTQGERVVYRERAVQSFARSFTLPLEVDSQRSVAKLENGVLSLLLPKLAQGTPSRITIS